MSRTASRSELPPPLRGADPDSFTQYTVTTRWPRIAHRVIDENDFSTGINDRLGALIEEIPDGTVRRIEDAGAPDLDCWHDWIDPYCGQTWREAPWFVMETYFYRRILEATGYFQPGPGHKHDPFIQQKQQGLIQSFDAIQTLGQPLKSTSGPRGVLDRLLRIALWGNQADLSMWAAGEESPNHLSTDREQDHLLINDTPPVLDHLSDRSSPSIVFLADNAGLELMADLALIDGLLTTDFAHEIAIHLKAHPTFVSDAMVSDVRTTLDTLATNDHEAVRELTGRLRTHQSRGQLRWCDSLIWTSPLRGRELPPLVHADLARADLVISKGDANYRRLVGDRHWPFTTPFERVVDYFPAPLLALRTLKAEVITGLRADQVEHLNETDPEWLVNGTWGVIQAAGLN